MPEEKVMGFAEFAGRWRHDLQALWEDLPKEMRQQLRETLGELPGDRRGWRRLIRHASQQWKFATGRRHTVVILGPANAGKSTLHNQLIQPGEARAAVSAVPGTTRDAQASDAGIFVLVDTPGADAVGAVGEKEREIALESAQQGDVLVALFDATHGIRQPEIDLFGSIQALGKPTIVALNKIDLIGKERATVLGKAAAALGLESDEVLPLSAKKGEGIADILRAVAKSEPEIVAALGQALPAYRWSLAQVQIGQAASSAALIAMTPLPFLDFIPLVGIQAGLVLGIGRIFGQHITLARARELLAVFGAGWMGRTIFYELSKLGGPPGWALAAAVAAGTTVAIGYGALMWFDRGERLPKDALQRMARDVSKTLIEWLGTMGRRRPGRSTLRERLLEALEATMPERTARADEGVQDGE